MRVLAIRGQNLASLMQPFEVDLERPPLADAGLFAIAGPTGVGKSTLLDALCLALFDAVPRLAHGSAAQVGGEGEPEALRLAANDVRSVLTRGAGQGYAEVDFVGNDGRRYRARWEVRRARGKADGRYQSQALSLLDLGDGRPLGRTKTEVLELIEDRLGLSFDQFRRAVLLAQGDFAAFLKAGERERSELLERITGTEIYGQISRAAYARAFQEGQALSELRARLAGVSPLEAGARAALEGEVAVARERLEAAEAGLNAARAARAWCDRQAGLESAAARAEEALAGEARALAEAAPRREQLRQVEAAEPLRAPLERAERTCAEHAAAAGELNTAREVEERARAQVSACEATVQAVLAEREAAGQALGAARPDLDAARRLDIRLADCRKRLEQAEKAQRLARQASEQAAEVLAARVARRGTLLEARDGAEQWLQANASLGALARDWSHWDAAVARYAASLDASRAARARLDALAAEAARAGQERDAARARQQATAEALEATRKALEGVETACAGYDLAALRAEEATLRERQETLVALDRCAREVRARSAAREEHLREAAALEAQAAEAERQAQAAAAAVEGKEQAIAEARTARDRLLAAASEGAEALRGQLRPGEPCPVCGALDHPWSAGAPVYAPLLSEATARLAVLEGERLGLVATQAGHATSARERRRRAEDRRASARQEEAELAALTLQWSARHAGEGLPADPRDAGVADALARMLGEVDAASAGLRGRLAAAIDCQTRRVAAIRARDGARQADDAAREALRTCEARVQGLEQDSAVETQRLESASAGVAAERDRLVTPLAPLPDWEAALAADPASFRADCERTVAAWLAHEQARASAVAELAELAARIAEAEATAQAAQEGAQKAAREAEAQSGECDRLASDRQVLLEGRPADEVEAGLQARERAALSAHRQAEADLASARSGLAAAGASARHWAAEAGRRAAECEEARRALEAALAAHGLDLESVRRLLAHDAGWLQAERRALDELVRRERDAGVLAAERRRQAQEHAATRPAGLECDGAAAALTRAEAQHALEQSAWAGAQGRLQEDDRRRKEAEALAAALASREASARVWEELRDLIGSADGNKYRAFAQSLTLDALLAHANRHLEDLARRYRLQRSPGSDLALQVVDCEMGDEVRSVYTLSGGESFLVSLALALGLASLASHRTRVESLFIDEGFGSLDPETLDTAIASLDALQALGRKVGVISHVPTLVERIGVQVRVEPLGGGRSRVRVLSSEPTPGR